MGDTQAGIRSIAFHKGMPYEVEVISVTGKRAKIRRPGTPMDSDIISLPVTELYAYDEEIFAQLMARVDKINIIRGRMSELCSQLQPLAKVLGAKAGGVGDDFWS
jgi:hypothetical protein